MTLMFYAMFSCSSHVHVRVYPVISTESTPGNMFYSLVLVDIKSAQQETNHHLITIIWSHYILKCFKMLYVLTIISLDWHIYT